MNNFQLLLLLLLGKTKGERKVKGGPIIYDFSFCVGIHGHRSPITKHSANHPAGHSPSLLLYSLRAKIMNNWTGAFSLLLACDL